MRDFSKFDQEKLQRELEREQQGEEVTVRLPKRLRVDLKILYLVDSQTCAWLCAMQDWSKFLDKV